MGEEEQEEGSVRVGHEGEEDGKRRGTGGWLLLSGGKEGAETEGIVEVLRNMRSKRRGWWSNMPGLLGEVIWGKRRGERSKKRGWAIGRKRRR